MPTYLGKTVSDEWLQGLLAAYRDGQAAAGLPVEDSDQVILDHMATNGVMAATAPSAYALGAGAIAPDGDTEA